MGWGGGNKVSPSPGSAPAQRKHGRLSEALRGREQDFLYIHRELRLLGPSQAQRPDRGERARAHTHTHGGTAARTPPASDANVWKAHHFHPGRSVCVMDPCGRTHVQDPKLPPAAACRALACVSGSGEEGWEGVGGGASSLSISESRQLSGGLTDG